ncbi:Isoprenyl transferase [Candidatus Cyrtobacter comes]|uniref:Isoprenyl transferase n=1 Tax=Candidatus Cyrtobacter comes TaxID=675776 RepID=A0ABU5L849_9RICK|nr:polyprenyl diphosphate synthase [Candidatus Cyrtobacter comes]MDZ5762080.1 Isoprenyl transferase [Candidatus Cyrtobacter comes]
MSFNIQKAPKHVAIIMDGNSRWAKEMNLPQWKGHESGMQSAKNIVDIAINNKIQYLTLYAFSIENWKRDKSEVDVIMSLMRQYMSEYAEDFINKGVRIIFSGDLLLIDSDISQSMFDIEESSKLNKVLTLIIAVSYSARNEIREAAMNMVKDAHKIDTSNKMIFDEYINIHNIPDPDLLIRTGGEYRLSNFMLWQIAYTELYFSKKLWPSFEEKDLLEAIQDFNSRERRYGGR